jgi:hypothetical protein
MALKNQSDTICVCRFAILKELVIDYLQIESQYIK